MTAKKSALALAAWLAVSFSACKNPMVNHLLGEEERERVIPFAPQSSVALLDTVWYYSLGDAIAAAGPGKPQTIYVRTDISRAAIAGGNGIVIPADKDITIEPYTRDIAKALIRRWKEAGVLVTVESGGSFTLCQTVGIDGWETESGFPLVLVKSGGVFTMRAGAQIAGGRVYVEYDSSSGSGGEFFMDGSAAKPTRIIDGDVFLETGALVTLVNVNVGTNPVACITPQQYRVGIQVIGGITAVTPPSPVPEITPNNKKFDVTPEDAPSGWAASRYWRVDNQGKLGMVIARRFDSGRGETLYYTDLQDAFNEAGAGEIILLCNLLLPPTVEINVAAATSVRLSVPEKETYTIRRAAAAGTSVPATETVNKSIFVVSPLASLELACQEGSGLVIDGGAIWSGSGSPATGAREANIGGGGAIINSTRPLVYVSGGGVLSGTLRLGRGVTLCNNDRISGEGGGIEADGHFYMSGGTVTRNRAPGGGGIYFKGDYDPLTPPNTPARVIREISGGSISGNDALLSGGGIMLDLSGWAKVTMKGGEIGGNRANGKYGAGVSADFDGYGGGVFIPGAATIENAFIMKGGSISGNTSASGLGNGIAIDRQRHPPAVFSLGGQVEIAHNDIHLRYYDAYNFPESHITLTGDLVVSAPVFITMNRYPADPDVNSYKSHQKIIGPDSSALVAANYDKFTVPAPYRIQSTGRLHTP